MDRSLSRLSVIAVAALALPVLAGCTGAERGGERYGLHCERLSAGSAIRTGTLATAVAHEAAANRRYRECVERNAVRVGASQTTAVVSRR